MQHNAAVQANNAGIHKCQHCCRASIHSAALYHACINAGGLQRILSQRSQIGRGVLPADMSTLKISLQVRIWPLTCCVILSPCAKIRSCPVAVSNINTLCCSSLPLRQHSYTRLATQAASDMHDPGSKQMQAPASQPVCMASSLLQSQLNCQLHFRSRTKTAYEDRQSHVKLQCVLLQCHE